MGTHWSSSDEARDVPVLYHNHTIVRFEFLNRKKDRIVWLEADKLVFLVYRSRALSRGCQGKEFETYGSSLKSHAISSIFDLVYIFDSS